MIKNKKMKFVALFFAIVLVCGGICYSYMKYSAYKEIDGALNSTFGVEKLNNDQIKEAEDILKHVEGLSINGKEVDKKLAKKIISHAKFRNDFVLWKGEYPGKLELNDGTEVIIQISNYGGFFTIDSKKGYYELTGMYRKTWDGLLENK